MFGETATCATSANANTNTNADIGNTFPSLFCLS